MDEIAKLFTKLAEQYGPQTVEAVRGAAIVTAYSSIQGALVGLAFSTICIPICKRMWKSTAATDMDINFAKIGAIALACIAMITAFISIASLTDPWLWVTLKNPDLWIAKKVFKI